MRKLILTSFLIVSICAYSQKYNFRVVFDKIEYKNIPKYFDLNKFSSVKIVDNNLQQEPILQYNLQAIVNDYADKIFKNIRMLMVENHMEPLQMPDMHSSFHYTLIITYHGELDLTNGLIHNIDSIHRYDDVTVQYSSGSQYLEVTVPIAFDELSLTLDYSAKIMGLGPVGGIEGKVNGIAAEVKIGFDTDKFQASLDEFHIINAGHISFHFNGNPLIDWLLNLLTEVVTTLLKDVILLITETIISGGVQSVIDTINDIINGIINPTTTFLPTNMAVQILGAVMDIKN